MGGVDISTAMDMAASLPEVEVAPHFHKISYRITKKIFFTIDDTKNEGVLKLTKTDQELLVDQSEGAINPVNGKWGLHGWTVVSLDIVDPKLFELGLIKAYDTVARIK